MTTGAPEPDVQTVERAGRLEDAFSSEGLAARVRRGMGALSLNAIVRVAGHLAIVPVAMTGWGAQRYGEWVILTGIVGFLRFSDLGLQTYAVNRLCAAYSTNRDAEMERVLHSALRVQVPLVGALFLLFGFASTLLPLDSLLSLRTVGGVQASVVAALLAFELLLGVPMGVIAGIYRATGRLARAGLIGSVQAVGQVALTLVLVADNRSFSLVAGARVLIAVLVCVWIIADLRRIYPWLRLYPARGAWRDGMGMVVPGLLFLLFPLADFLSTQVSLVALQKVTDGELVSRFATHRTAVNAAMMASGLVINSVWPELTALYARGSHGELRRLQRSLVRDHTWLIAGITLGMLPLLPWVYSSWTVGRLAIDSWTLGLLMSRVLLWGFWSGCLTVLQATNRHGAAAASALASATTGALLAIVLVPHFGMRGAAAALLLGDLCFSAWLIPMLAARETGDRVAVLVRGVGRALGLNLGVPLVLVFTTWCLLPEGIVRQVAVPAFTVVLGLLAAIRHFSLSPRALLARM